MIPRDSHPVPPAGIHDGTQSCGQLSLSSGPDDEINAASAALAAAPAALDRAMIANALACAKPSLARCARPATQQIRVSIAVMPAGTVERIIVRDHVDAATSDCLTGTLHATLFPMTQRGGSFTYPFTL